jgi:integrase
LCDATAPDVARLGADRPLAVEWTCRRHIKDFLARKRAGGLSKNSVRLIRATTGTLIEVVAVGKRFRLVLRQAGPPRFRLYDLRHTYATHLLAEEAADHLRCGPARTR